MAGRSTRANFRPVTVGQQQIISATSHNIEEPRRSSKALLVEKNKNEGLSGRPLAVVSIPPDDSDSEELIVKDCKCIGSYSWVHKAWNEPTILVPGLPRKFGDKTALPYKVPSPDQGIRIIDQNGARTSYGNIGYFVPLVSSVIQCHKTQGEPSFDWTSVDIVADRAALRKLSRWASAKLSVQPTNYESHTNFRLDLQLAGEKTLLINRRPLRFAEPYVGYTYRTGFEKGFITYPVSFRNAIDYYRILNYDMKGLNMVVRFEVDAYASTSNGSDDKGVDSLADALRKSSLGSPTTSNMHGLTVQERGQTIPSSSIIELSTRSVKNRRPLDWNEIYSQLFLSQTAKYIVACHEDGLFTEIKEWSPTDQEFNAAREEGQKHMKRLCNVLTFIRDMVIPYGRDSRLSLVCDHGVLKLYKRGKQESSLPDDLLELFNETSVPDE